MKKILQKLPYKFIFWCIIPLLLFVAIIPFYTSHPINYYKEVIDFCMTFFILYSIGILLPKKSIKRIWFVLAGIIMGIIAFFKISFYSLFQSNVTLSAFYIIFETNANEATDFLRLYLDFLIIITAIIILVSVVFQVRYLYSKKHQDSLLFSGSIFKRKSILISTLLVGGIVCTLYVINLKFRVYNIYHIAKDSFVSYAEMKEVFKSVLANKTTEHLIPTSVNEDDQTYIIVIGESTTSKNMSLYGYYRETSPLLQEIEDELFIFKNVLAPHAHTIPSLNKILTLSNYEELDALEKGSLIQLANAAGYTTYWISNQQPIGIYENMVTVLSKACDVQVFTSEENLQYGSLDEAVLPHIDTILNQSDKKKLIIVHLIGTHSTYKFRYPKHFNTFLDTPKTLFPSKRSHKLINEYDNAILYNDYVVRSIIDTFKTKDKNGFLVYFSDHGEEVFHTIDFVGHSEYQATPAMMEVPFILWMSEKFKNRFSATDSLSQYTSRKYLLDDFIHSFADLSQMEFNLWEPERSIFNPKFKDRKRIIKRSIDYDEREKN